MIIKKLIETKKKMSWREWEEFEKELSQQNYVIHNDNYTLTELLKMDPVEFTYSIVKLEVLKKEKDIQHDVVWYEKKGYLFVSIRENEITLDIFYPNSPKTTIDSDMNSITLYKTEEGYFIPSKWKLLTDFTVKYIMVQDAETDGAQKVVIVEK